VRTLRIGLLFVAAAISGLASISGIAVDKAGNVYFSDWTANKIWKIDPQGNAEVVAQKHTHHLFIDADGNLYGEHVAQEGGAASFWKRTPQGQIVDVIPPPQPGQSPIFEGGAFTISHDGSVITPIGCRM
jgi:hypothetical protein